MHTYIKEFPTHSKWNNDTTIHYENNTQKFIEIVSIKNVYYNCDWGSYSFKPKENLINFTCNRLNIFTFNKLY